MLNLRIILDIVVLLLQMIIIFLGLYFIFKKKNKTLDNLDDNENENSETIVKEIMTPRTSLFALEDETLIKDCIEDIKEQGFSRIPIYKDNIDNIVGIVYIKDLLNVDLNKKIGEFKRKGMYIPETMNIDKLLEEFQIKRLHMAIIIDEYGGTAGIITIEDILEETVGEIRDEYDEEEDSVKEINDKVFEIQGDTPVLEVDEELGIDIPVSEEYDTISGFVQFHLGKVAEVNDQITEEGYIIKVTEVDNKRIVKLKIILLNLGGKDND